MGRARGHLLAALPSGRGESAGYRRRLRVTQGLADFAEELGRRPSARDFERHGREELLQAVAQEGGLASFRDHVAHLPRTTRAPGSRAGGRPPGEGRWNDITIWRELEAYTRGRASFPSFAEMDADGRADLRGAISKAGGIQRWAGLLDLPLGFKQDCRPYDHEDALRDARAVIREHGGLPGKHRIRALGYPRLATYLATRSPGGSRAFMARHREQLQRGADRSHLGG